MLIKEISSSEPDLQRLEKELATKLADNTFMQFALDVIKLNPKQLTQLELTIRKSTDWFMGAFMRHRNLGQVIDLGEDRAADYFRIINFFQYMTKYCVPDVVLGFDIVYRVQPVPGNVKNGDVVAIRPEKSITSWSVNPIEKLHGRRKASDDYILATHADSQRVLWSYKFAAYAPAVKTAIAETARLAKKYRLSTDQLIASLEFDLENLANAVMYGGEKEVILYNGGKPFKATIYKKVI